MTEADLVLTLTLDTYLSCFLGLGAGEGLAGLGGCLQLRGVCCGSCWCCLLCRVDVCVCLLLVCARVARSCASVSGLPLRVLLLPVLGPSFVFSSVFPVFSAVLSGFRISLSSEEILKNALARQLMD